ncbi:unnamed protein product [Lymnaea stagnalis]|uniref:Uncharacterized protein n=1 Tax=Lymnaea stagnalis TaxID=6523 RepID=A0AAV2HN06_LYMST
MKSIMRLLSSDKLQLSKRLRKCLLVANTVGIDACAVFEMLLMIANIQTLGVPIRFASLPGTVAAILAAFLIPTIGLLLSRSTLSKRANGIIVFATSCLQIFGTLLVFTANTVKLLYYDHPPGHVTYLQSRKADNRTYLSLGMSTTSSLTPNLLFNNSSSVYGVTSLTYGDNMTGNSSYVLSHGAPTVPPDIRFYAILAMIGFALIDAGYDTSTCFLKTFAVALTPPKEHSNIIFMSIVISSIGGCLIAVLGSVGLGKMLTAGTAHDSNAAQCALLSGLCFVLMVFGLTSTLITGFSCPPISESTTPLSESKQEATNDNGYISSQNDIPTETTKLSTHLLEPYNGVVLESQSCQVTDDIIDGSARVKRTDKFSRFIKKWKKQIILNVSTFFLIGAVYSFAIYGVNFLGRRIFNGDPLADVSSQAYKNYLKGIEAGSLGHLTYYGAFSVFNLFQGRLMQRIGWKLVISGTALCFAAGSLLCALTSALWTYYLCAVFAGLYRSMVATIPYILANQFALEQADTRSSTMPMTFIATMLPLNFIICSGIMGPLIDATDNPASSFYYTAFCAILGMCFSNLIN